MKKINMYGLNESILRGLEQYKITLITKKYERTSSGKSWRKNPVETDEEVISPKKFELIISSIPFFRDLGGSERVTKGYTCTPGVRPLLLYQPITEFYKNSHFFFARENL